MADSENPKVGPDTKPKQFGNRGMGRPKGSENRTSAALKKALLLATDHAGYKVALNNEHDRIERLRSKIEREGRDPTPEEEEELKVKPEIIENSGLMTYLVDLAVKQPNSFASLLGRVITVQQQDEERGVVAHVGPRTITIDIGYIEHGPFKAIEHA